MMREWALWAIRNLCEGNPENQQFVAALKLAGQTPEKY